MAQYTPEDSADGASFIVSVTPDAATINTLDVGGTTYKMIAHTVTTEVEFRGLSRSQAIAMSKSNDYNYVDKHGVRYRGSGSWMAMPECEGAECKAVSRRINDADMFRVLVTHVSTTVTHSGNWTKETF